MIKYLYRYQSLRSPFGKLNLERLLLHNEVYCSSPLSFNDPFDCLVAFSESDITDESIQTILKYHYSRFHPNKTPEQVEQYIQGEMKSGKWHNGNAPWKEWMNEYLKKLKQDILPNTGIVCFSEEHEDILMWGHYADGHRGVCIQFDKSVLEGIVGSFDSVKYLPDFPSLNEYASGGCRWRNDFFILTKSIRWKYEGEWRLVVDTTVSKIFKLPENAVSGVILGCEMPSDDEKQIRDWLGERADILPIYKAFKKETSYGLDIPHLADSIAGKTQ